MSQIHAGEFVKEVRAIAKIENAYHQLRTIVIDYGVPVTCPEPAHYLVRDHDTANFREAFNWRPYSDAPIAAVYTSNTPYPKADKTPTPGRFVVLELALIEGCVVEDGIHKPPHNAGVCTWRKTGDASDWRRTDFSGLQISQVLPLQTADGTVIQPGRLPTLLAEQVTTQEQESFREEFFPLPRGGQMYVCYHLPQDMETTGKRYPLVLSISGGGGLLREENGHSALGGHLTRDRGATAWLDANEEVIVLSPQIPVEESRNLEKVSDDIMSLVRQFIEAYPVDTQRVYAIGSSLGTKCISTILRQPRYAELFTAYIQCNGHFEGARNMFLEDFDKPCAEELLNLHTLEDFEQQSLWLHGGDFFASDTFAEMAEALAPMVEHRVAVDIWHGINDEIAPVGRGVTTYLTLRELYRRAGLSPKATEELVRIHLIPTQTFHNMGIFSYHQASKVAVSHPGTLARTLGLTKTDLQALK